MFELITISNGQVVVRQTVSGHVFRFRPRSPAAWRSLVLDRIDDGGEAVEDDRSAALVFAETAAAACMAAAGEPPASPARASGFRDRFSIGRLRGEPADRMRERHAAP